MNATAPLAIIDGLPQLPNIPRSGQSKSLAEATINQRLAAQKALVVMGLNLGVCDFTLARVKGKKLLNTAIPALSTAVLCRQYWRRAIGQR